MDCATCQSSLDPLHRAAMGCGWLDREPDAGDEVQVWTHPGDVVEYSTCPGYTTAIPDVEDVAAAHLHWEKGQLELRLGDQEPAPALMNGIEILHGAVERFRAWAANSPKPKEPQ